MESQINTPKRSLTTTLFNKITDTINKDKWDKSCVNTALFDDTTVKEKDEKEVLDKFEKQIKEFHNNVEENSKWLGAANIKSDDLKNEILDEYKTSTDQDIDDDTDNTNESDISNNDTILDTNISEEIAEPHEEFIEKEIDGHIIKIAKKCYYIKFTYDNDDINKVIVRSCDSKRVWTNKDSDKTYPHMMYCPKCGLPIEYMLSNK